MNNHFRLAFMSLVFFLDIVIFSYLFFMMLLNSVQMVS